MKKTESKYVYTATLMQQALLFLLEKKELEYISITEITKKAGVNRSTFYLHYDNIYELFEETVEQLNKEFVDTFLEKGKMLLNTKQSSFFITAEYLKPYLLFVKKNKRVLKLIHQKPQLFGVEKAHEKMREKIFYPAIANFVDSRNEQIYRLEYYTRGVMAIINKWTELDCVTEIDELMEIIKSCVGYTEEK